ncbi:protein NIM1-INTERACTING 1 [Ricinus communis]|uniref:protein NIM1-INTERACTING 1 n=1 Tax=Ricinus communis TaxID=3988 RepID=UPI00201A5787|nr:protein NIM1-INTERACTING 1 [Ricinus communis]
MENGKITDEGSVCNADEDDEQEDQKVEEFFALIRRIREARNRRKDEVQEEEKRKNKIRRLNEEHPSWVPSFEWEDFTEEIQFRSRPPVIFPRPCNQKQEKKQPEKDGGLDLKLTL